jgi:hypothetical protein
MKNPKSLKLPSFQQLSGTFHNFPHFRYFLEIKNHEISKSLKTSLIPATFQETFHNFPHFSYFQEINIIKISKSLKTSLIPATFRNISQLPALQLISGNKNHEKFQSP